MKDWKREKGKKGGKQRGVKEGKERGKKCKSKTSGGKKKGQEIRV